MAEKSIVISYEELNYEGLFSIRELFDLIDKWSRERGYDEHEKKNYEQHFPSGRQIEIELQPYRKITDYVMYLLKIEMQMLDVKDVEIVKNKKKIKTNHGKLRIFFHAFLVLDYFNKWEGRGYFIFLRSLFDKIFYRRDTEKYRQGLVTELNQLRAQMKQYLNVYQGKYRMEDVVGVVDTGVSEELGETKPVTNW